MLLGGSVETRLYKALDVLPNVTFELNEVGRTHNTKYYSCYLTVNSDNDLVAGAEAATLSLVRQLRRFCDIVEGIIDE